MKRLLLTAICVYGPHLLEEYFTEMWRDPLLAPVLDRLAHETPQHAAYDAFQITFALGLTMTLAFSAGKRSRAWVMLGLAVSLLGESHHVIRFLISHSYNSGLVTALPMPVVGASILVTLFRRRASSCSTTSFS